MCICVCMYIYIYLPSEGTGPNYLVRHYQKQKCPITCVRAWLGWGKWGTRVWHFRMRSLSGLCKCRPGAWEWAYLYPVCPNTWLASPSSQSWPIYVCRGLNTWADTARWIYIWKMGWEIQTWLVLYSLLNCLAVLTKPDITVYYTPSAWHVSSHATLLETPSRCHLYPQFAYEETKHTEIKWLVRVPQTERGWSQVLNPARFLILHV